MPVTAELTPRQREVRSRGIGSSDAAAACGMSPWKSRVQLWLEKTGRSPEPDLDDREDIHFGKVLEDIVAQEFTRRRGRKVQRWSTPYQRDFMVANVDRLIVGENAILECKTASAWTQQKWDDVPEYYRIQVEHQLITADKHDAVLAVLIGGNKYDDWEIQRSKDLSEAIVAKEREFWQFVLDDVPPPPQSAADVIALFPVDTGNVKIADPEIAEIHRELMAVRDEYKDVERRKVELEDRIKLFLGADSTVLLSEGGQPIVTWKAARASEVTNWKAAALEMADKLGEIGQAILLAHTRSVPGSRRFLPKPIKEAK